MPYLNKLESWANPFSLFLMSEGFFLFFFRCLIKQLSWGVVSHLLFCRNYDFTARRMSLGLRPLSSVLPIFSGLCLLTFILLWIIFPSQTNQDWLKDGLKEKGRLGTRSYTEWQVELELLDLEKGEIPGLWFLFSNHLTVSKGRRGKDYKVSDGRASTAGVGRGRISRRQISA